MRTHNRTHARSQRASRHTQHRGHSHVSQQLEYLESRVLLSATSLAEVDAPLFSTPSGAVSPGATWLSPTAVRNFYGFNSISYTGGVTGDGAGQTIAIIDWGHDANAAGDLDVFDHQYGVNGNTTTLYSQYGAASTFFAVYAQDTVSHAFGLASGVTNLPANAATGSMSSSPSDYEISLDVQWAHALAPGADIVLIEAEDASTTRLTDAINYAHTLGASVVSMSFGLDDTSGSRYTDANFTQSGMTYVAAAGDNGSYLHSEADFSVNSSGWTGTLGSTSDSATRGLIANQSGDFAVVLQVGAGTTDSQAGITFRDSSANNAANVSFVVRPGNTGLFQYRTTTGGTTSSFSVASAIVGNYIALTRAGNVYTAYTSTDSTTWTTLNTVTIALASTVEVDVVGAGTSPSNDTFSAFGAFYTSVSGVSSPATSVNVIAVGGTSATVNGSGTITAETTAWGAGANSYWQGGGGGAFSTNEAKPHYQDLVNIFSNRAISDVSFDAGTPVAIYDSINASPGWFAVRGTSFSAPAWAALVAVADQGRAINGFSNLSSQYALERLYQLSSSDFHDITSGSIGLSSAGSGYDVPTGLGTPVANLVASDLGNTGAFGFVDTKSSVSVSGWAYDPDSGTGSIQVALYIDGVFKANYTANQAHGALDGVFTNYYTVHGANHGFTIDLTSYGITLGNHTINIQAIDDEAGHTHSANLGGGGTVTNHSSTGHFDAITNDVAIGWGWDVDSGAASIKVTLIIDGSHTITPYVTAGLTRSDLAGTTVGLDHGFSIDLRPWINTFGLTTGNHTVVLWSIDTNDPVGGNTALNSITLNNAVAIGYIDTINGSKVLSGWAFDKEADTGSITVHIYVDGSFYAATTANGTHSGLDNYFDTPSGITVHGNNHGYSYTLSALTGSHTISVYAIDPAGNGTNPLLQTVVHTF